jgi:transcriptional regulator
MYVPRHFENRDRATIVDLIRGHPLAILVTMIDDQLEATHVPVVLDADRGEHGALRFHLSHANPTAHALDGARDVLLVFTGPEAYISPDWYEAEQLVPTWNYAAVHAWGRPAPMDDAALCRLLDDLSAEQEQQISGKRPWTTATLDEDRYQKMRRAIIGFDMVVSRLEAKWKMSQNRSPADRAGATAALDARGGERNSAVAAIMALCEADLTQGP